MLTSKTMQDVNSTDSRKQLFAGLVFGSLLFVNFVFDGYVYLNMASNKVEQTKMEEYISTMQLQSKMSNTDKELSMLKILLDQLLTESAKSSRPKRSTNDKDVRRDGLYDIVPLNRTNELGRKWHKNGSVFCVRCPRGQKGEMGPRGPKGGTGKAGPMGSKGIKGPVGIPGPEGPRGPRGHRGKDGPRGIKGQNGDPGESISAPRIYSPPKFTEALSGNSATFYCGAKGDPIPDIEWKLNDKSLTPNQFHYRNQGDLVINTENVSGGKTKISCSAKNILGTASEAAILSVLVKPSATINPKQFVSIRGTEMIIKCIATGFPAPEISWSKDDGKFPKSARKLENGRTLMISKTGSGDGGRYTCKATNKVGSSLASSLTLVRDGKSCSDVWNNGHKTNGMYNIEKAGLVYCHMVSIPGCGDGGWTQVIKMDGTKETFKYDSPLWHNKQSYNDRSGQGMNTLETKTKAYWTINFDELCVGMRRGSDLKWLLISYKASSLHELLASGRYQATKIGRDRWKMLINRSSLQLNCNKEGFNVFQLHYKVRIGMVNNEQNHCHSTDSFIGFGSNYAALSCGNAAHLGGDNGDTRETFKYDSPLWYNRQSYNDRSGQGMNTLETKTKAYWTINVNGLCVGMRRGSALKWLLISYKASSLKALIGDGWDDHVPTNIGRDRWKTLIKGSSLQLNCNKEGFNVDQGNYKVRIGMVNNEQNDCYSSESFIGFGSNKRTLSCGNTACCGGDNGNTSVTTLGYIFVQ